MRLDHMHLQNMYLLKMELIKCDATHYLSPLIWQKCEKNADVCPLPNKALHEQILCHGISMDLTCMKTTNPTSMRMTQSSFLDGLGSP